jgi:hypothetical protein
MSLNNGLRRTPKLVNFVGHGKHLQLRRAERQERQRVRQRHFIKFAAH